MSTTVIKLAGNTFTANQTANVVPCNAGSNSTTGATFLYVFNNGAAASTITVANSGGNIGSIVLGVNAVMMLEKYTSDTIVASVNVVCTPCAKAW